MSDMELIKLWKSGLDKYKVAEVYRRYYNQRVKIIRRDMRHRHEKFMSQYDALEHVEEVILKYVRYKNN